MSQQPPPYLIPPGSLFLAAVKGLGSAHGILVFTLKQGIPLLLKFI